MSPRDTGKCRAKALEAFSSYMPQVCERDCTHVRNKMVQNMTMTMTMTIHPRCYHLAQNSLKLHMAKRTGSRGLCAPISIIQGNCLMVLGKWRDAIKKKQTNKKKQQQKCSLYSFYAHYCLITNSQIYYSWPIITYHFHFGSAISAKWGKKW